ncbi:MAG: hypothetical protein ACRDGR_05225 [bacterium]
MIDEATRDAALAAVPSDAPPADLPPVRDQLLQCSRRVDWRFLLASPELGRVGLVGDATPDLVDSLRQFGQSLTTHEVGVGVGAHLAGTCDVVVLRSLRPEGLVTAAALLRAGGSLYWEVEKSWRPGGESGKFARFPASPAARGLLADLGFGEPRYHWHRPSFAECLEIVPLHDEEALMWALAHGAGSWSGSVRLGCARLLRVLGLLGLMTPCWSCVARKTDGER